MNKLLRGFEQTPGSASPLITAEVNANSAAVAIATEVIDYLLSDHVMLSP
jgi:hypothetical protein